MISRKKTHKKKGRFKINKMFIGFLLLVVIIGSSINVVFADQDIQSLLTNWFNKEKDQSITELDKAISTEQGIQTKRLKETLQSEIRDAEAELHTFTDKEIDKRISQLQSHADQLINSVSIDNSDEKNRVTRELEAILKDGQRRMNAINVETEPVQDAVIEPEADTKPKPDTGTDKENEVNPADKNESKQPDQSRDKAKKEQGAE